MSELKLNFREYQIPNEQHPYRDVFIELMATLDLKISGKYEKRHTPECKQKLKQKLADVFKQTLYGQVIYAINKAEYETQTACYFDYSSADKIKKAFEELRNSIPKITHD